MKINQNQVAALILGIVIGALIVGFWDANRPKPLLSSFSKPSASSNMKAPLTPPPAVKAPVPTK